MVKILSDSFEWDYDPTTETLTVFSRAQEISEEGVVEDREALLTDQTIDRDCDVYVKSDVARTVHLDWLNRK